MECQENVRDIVEMFTQFPIEFLSETWIQEVWENCFTDVDGLNLDWPKTFNDDCLHAVKELLHNVSSRICKLRDSITQNKEEIQTNTPNSYCGTSVDVQPQNDASCGLPSEESEQVIDLWTSLLDNNIQSKNILAFIYFIFQKSQKLTSKLLDKELSIRCARFYFNMLTLPGSSAFRVFQPNLLESALDCLKLPKIKHSRKRPAPRVRHASSCSSKRMCRTESYDSEGQVCDTQSDDGQDDGETEFDASDCERLYSYMPYVLKDLVYLLNILSLKKDHSLLEHTVLRLVECTTLETEHCELPFAIKIDDCIKTINRYNPLYVATLLAYKALMLICQPLHGNVCMSYNIVFKTLMPNILLMRLGGNQLFTRHQQNIKDHAVSFICYLIQTDEGNSLRSAYILLQQLCARVFDRAEFRNKVAQSVVQILAFFPLRYYAKMMEWLYKFVHHTKIQHRIFGLDLFSQILLQPERKPSSDLSDKVNVYLSYSTIVNCIVGRCNDKASSVRAKALSILANCTETILSNLQYKGQITSRAETESNVRTWDHGAIDLSSDPQNTPSNCTSSETEAVNHSVSHHFERNVFLNMLKILHSRAKDVRVNVRKAALQALERFICLEKCFLTDKNAKLFQEHCRDPSVCVRKQAIYSMTSILEIYPQNTSVQFCWLEGIMPLVLDPESSVQEKCLEAMEIVLLNGITAKEQQVSWDILSMIANGDHQDCQRYLQKAVYMWTKNGKIRTNILTCLKHHIGGKNDMAVWLLLSQVAMHVEIRNPQFVLDYWDKFSDSQISTSAMQRILQVIGYSAKYLPLDKAKDIQENLEFQLQQFVCPPSLIATSIETLCKVYKAQSQNDSDAQSVINTFCKNMLQASDAYLAGVILDENCPTEENTEDKIVKHIFTLGELAQLCPHCIPSRLFLIIQSVIASAPSTKESAMPCVFRRISKSSPDKMQLKKSSVTLKIRAHAFIALGKICLQNEEFAKQSVAALAKELESSECAIIRNNVIVIMIDLCIRYAILVDPYMSSVTACLRDTSLLVRQQTLILLTQLLQEDYLKWKGTIFFRMLITLVDESSEIRNFAEYSLGHILQRRHQHIFYQHFVECIFYFNCYFGHKTYNKFNVSDQEIELFSLKGSEYKEKRMALYKFMLENMNDEERFNLNLKLCQDILGAIPDNVIPLNQDTLSLVQDALAILCCEEIKLSSLTTTMQDEVEESEVAAAIVATAKKALSQIVKKNVIENIVPIVIALKHTLAKIKSPLLKDLMMFLQELLKDYKNEVKEILSADKQLAKEIEFDLQWLERQQQREQRNETRNNRISDVISVQQKSISSKRTSEIQHSIVQSTLRESLKDSFICRDLFNNTSVTLERCRDRLDSNSNPLRSEIVKSLRKDVLKDLSASIEIHDTREGSNNLLISDKEKSQGEDPLKGGNVPLQTCETRASNYNIDNFMSDKDKSLGKNLTKDITVFLERCENKRNSATSEKENSVNKDYLKDVSVTIERCGNDQDNAVLRLENKNGKDDFISQTKCTVPKDSSKKLYVRLERCDPSGDPAKQIHGQVSSSSSERLRGIDNSRNAADISYLSDTHAISCTTPSKSNFPCTEQQIVAATFTNIPLHYTTLLPSNKILRVCINRLSSVSIQNLTNKGQMKAKIIAAEKTIDTNVSPQQNHMYSAQCISHSTPSSSSVHANFPSDISSILSPNL